MCICLEPKLRSIDIKLWNQVCLKIKYIESYFQFCKTLGLSNSRVESWEKLSVRKTKVGSVLRRSRWDSASVFAPVAARVFVGLTQEGSAEESEQRTEREWNQSYCHHPVYGLCALWCRQVAHQTKQCNPSCLHIVNININIVLYTDTVHCGAGRLLTRQNNPSCLNISALQWAERNPIFLSHCQTPRLRV